MVRRLHIPDCHFPAVDRKAYNLMLDVATDWKPHEIVIYGDFFDCYALSTFSKDPKRMVQLIETEIGSGTEALCHLVDKFKKVIFLCGNHEHRFHRFISTYSPLLTNEITFEKVFGIPDSVRVIPYGQKNIYDMGGLIATHGTIFNTHVAASMIQKYGRSVVFGHTHRIQRYVKKNMGGESEAINIGWLGDFSKADYKDTDEWSHAFGLSYHSKNNYSFDIVHIKGGRAIVYGKEY